MQAMLLDERLARSKSLLTLLRENPLFSAAYIGYEKGDLLAVVDLDNGAVQTSLHAPSGASYLVHAVIGAGQNYRNEYFFYSADDTLLERRPLADKTF